MFKKHCPLCGKDHNKAMYMGLPMKICKDPLCNCLWGFWSWVPNVYFIGGITVFEGSYWAVMRDFVRGKL